LRYDLAPDHIRYALEEIRAVLQQNNRVEDSTSRVRLLRFAEWAIEVEIYAYILVRDFAEFLAIQEELLLEIVDTIERTGAAVALPSQATLVTKDAWIDPEKEKAAKAAIGKERDPGVPGMPTP
jgi:MscS family membrane protein